MTPKQITQAREKLGLNKTQLAKELRVAPSHISMLEAGIKNPSPMLIAFLESLVKKVK